MLVRAFDREMMVSDFCPEIHSTGYRNKATEPDLFPLRTGVAKPFPSSSLGGSAAGDIIMQNEVLELTPLGHRTPVTVNP